MTTSSSYRLFFIPVMIFIVLLFYKKLYAADITVTTTVDQNPATLEDIITLSVTVQGVRQSTSPVLPNLSDFRVHGRSTSSSVRIINGTMKASVTHNYQLIPHKPGVFSIGPVKVNVAGQVYESNALKMTINKPLSQGPEVQSLAFAKLSVSNPKPYIHEQVILTLRLYRRIDVKNINLNWSFDSFQKEDLGKGREYPEVVNGLKYLVHELQVALFGSRLGSFKIDRAIFREYGVIRKIIKRDSNSSM